MADSMRLIAVGLLFIAILFSGCAGQCPPAGLPQPPGCSGGAIIQQNETSVQNATTQPKPGSADEFGCLPSDCSTVPAGVGREFCEQYKAGTYVWAPDCSAYPSEECRTLCSSRSKTGSSNGVTFDVEVPSNTPSDAVIFMEVNDPLGSFYVKRMMKVNSTSWQLTLSITGTVRYRYNWDNMAFLSAEEFSPDSDATRRSAIVKSGDVIKDKIVKWRWFPAPGETLPAVDNAAASTPIADRVNSEKFQRGYMLVDFWWVPMHDLVVPTDSAMKASHGDWVQIRPAWDYIQTDPPVMGYEGFGHTYKSGAYGSGDLDFNIAQSQTDGLDVLLIPQLCCNNPPGDKQYSQAWWDAWFAQMENYSIYYADIAESHNVTRMIMQDDYLWGAASSQVPDVKQRYAHYISVIKQHYRGKLGYFISTGASYKEPGALYPSLDEIASYSPDQMDFFAVSMWTGVTDSDQPTVAEMETNFKKVFDSALKPVYDKYRKPLVIVSAAYPSIDGGMKGTTGVFDSDIQVWYNYTSTYSLDLVEQAQGYEALMQAIAETPYITGLYPFTYWPLPLPETKEFNIRGKPAEQVVSAWYEQFEKQGK